MYTSDEQVREYTLYFPAYGKAATVEISQYDVYDTDELWLYLFAPVIYLERGIRQAAFVEYCSRFCSLIAPKIF